MKKLSFLLLFTYAAIGAQIFTKTDTLKGSDTAFRNFWDVRKYELSVEANFQDKYVSGSNIIYFEITRDIINPVFQIDLQQPMNYSMVSSKNLTHERNGDFIFITSNRKYKKGEKGNFEIRYSGHPKIAKNAPWDGGWVFNHDENGFPFVSVAQEGDGVSLWLPTKDIWNDEPDQGIKMSITTPAELTGVGNGRMISKISKNGKTTYTWEVKNSINPYSIVPNIGKYVNFKDTFNGEKGKLDLDYWVLDYNLQKAKKQFTQVKPMLSAMEYWFGPYPFYEDSYKIVETPYLGMEHQSNIAYGNRYMNGYLGNDNSYSGKGLGWDYIIVHESGHEWFANNITATDHADMWIHEAFTTYSETLFVEKTMDRESADLYVRGQRLNIENDLPIIGKYGLRNEGSTDMYYKGANMLHMIRTIIGDDAKFRDILRGLNRDFRQQTVTGAQVENYISQKSGIDFTSVFNQYLRTADIPVLEYSQIGKQLTLRFQNVVQGFKMPFKINGNQTVLISDSWQRITLPSPEKVQFDPNYLVYFQEKK